MEKEILKCIEKIDDKEVLILIRNNAKNNEQLVDYLVSYFGITEEKEETKNKQAAPVKMKKLGVHPLMSHL